MRDAVVHLTRALAKIEKAVTENDTALVLRELLAKITDISAKAKGDKGDDGYTPKKGKDYRDGVDGRSIVRADIDEKGRLTILFSDGKEKNLGRIVGTDGKDAKVDLEAMAKKVLALVKVTPVDLDALATAAAAKLKSPPSVEAIIAALKKDISFADLKDAPDFEEIVRRYTRHLEEREQGGVYAGSTTPIFTVKNEGVIVSEYVRSIDFRGGAVDVVDLGNGELVATITGGASSATKTEVVTGTQDGDNVRIPLSQLAFPPTAYEWLSRNGQVLSPGPAQPDGEYSSWEIDGTDVVVYWALEADRFLFNYTYTV